MTLVEVMSFLMAVIALHMGHVPPFFHGNNTDSRGKKVDVTTLSPSSATLGILFVVLFLLGVGGRSLLSER